MNIVIGQHFIEVAIEKIIISRGKFGLKMSVSLFVPNNIF